eukprot:gene19099-21015_t
MQSPILTFSILLTVVVSISMIDGGHSLISGGKNNRKPGKKEIMGYLCQDKTRRECIELVNEWMKEEMRNRWQDEEKEDMTKYENRSAKLSRLIVALRNLKKKEEYKESTYENV